MKQYEGKPEHSFLKNLLLVVLSKLEKMTTRKERTVQIMDDMPNWNAFVKRTLSDKGENGNIHAQLNVIKRFEKNNDILEKERLKDGKTE